MTRNNTWQSTFCTLHWINQEIVRRKGNRLFISIMSNMILLLCNHCDFVCEKVVIELYGYTDSVCFDTSETSGRLISAVVSRIKYKTSGHMSLFVVYIDTLK